MPKSKKRTKKAQKTRISKKKIDLRRRPHKVKIRNFRPDDIRPEKGLWLHISTQMGEAQLLYLRKEVPRLHKIMGSRLKELSLALVNAPTMTGIHQRFLRAVGPTDVLTFPLETDGRGTVTSAEIVICVPEARREARVRDLPIRNEIMLYIVHALLHLQGYDDQTEAGAQKMHQEEDRILKRMGIGNVYGVKPVERYIPPQTFFPKIPVQ